GGENKALPPPQAPYDLPARIRARRSRDSAAGMRPGAAEIQPLDRSPVPGPPQQWTKREELIERVLAMKNMPARQTVGLLQIQGRQDLAMNNNLTNIRRIFRKGFENCVGKFAAARIAVAGAELIW